MRNKIIAICIVVLMLVGTGCSKDASEVVRPTNPSLDDVLFALEHSGIEYKSRAESNSSYDLQREDTERHLYELDSGNLTIYIFPSVELRRKVQSDPFPTAMVIAPNGSYGIGKMLIYYYDGDKKMEKKLSKAFESLGAEE